jgi:hypothetical protein
MRCKAAVVIATLCLAVLAAAGKDEQLDQILNRAASASTGEQISLYTQAAEHQLHAADQLYTAGKADEAVVAVHDVVTYSDKACDAATRSGSKLKNTEIAMRKMAAKLRDIKRSLAFEDQQPVQDAADHLETLRTGLLSRMFGKKK